VCFGQAPLTYPYDSPVLHPGMRILELARAGTDSYTEFRRVPPPPQQPVNDQCLRKARIPWKQPVARTFRCAYAALRAWVHGSGFVIRFGNRQFCPLQDLAQG